MTRGAQGEESRYHTSHLSARVWSAILAVALFAVTAVPLVLASSWPDTPAVVQAQFDQGQIGYFSENGIYKYRLWVEAYHFLWEEYRLYLFEASASSPFTITLFHQNNNGTTLWFTPSIEVNVTYTVFYLSGTPGGSNSYICPPDRQWRNLIPQFGTAQWRVGEFSVFLYDGLDHSDLYNDYFLSTQFIQFTPDVPDQVHYQSYLPEPQWDLHNRYLIVNDKLYWISFYINSAYIQQMSVENGSQVYQQSASGSEDGTYLDMSTSAYFYYHANESITYNGLVYYPVSIQDMSLSFEDMICPCLVSGSSWRLSFDTDFFADYFNLQNGFLLDYRIYVSSFDLITGEYIESIYSENTQLNNQDISLNIDLPEDIASIYCYGVNFINRQNLPVNLASIVWSYDFEFATWRSEISSQLQAIYNLLSQSDTPTTSQLRDYGSAVSEVSGLPTYDSSDIADVLGSAVSDVNSNLSSGIEWGQGWFTRIYNDIPELFIVVVLALAFGLTLLILGKKKSDS